MARHNHPTDEFIESVGRMVRAAGRRVAKSDPPDLAALIGLRDVLNDAIQEAVNGQRSMGITWGWIGEATGTTPQAAIQKWKEGTKDVL